MNCEPKKFDKTFYIEWKVENKMNDKQENAIH